MPRGDEVLMISRLCSLFLSLVSLGRKDLCRTTGAVDPLGPNFQVSSDPMAFFREECDDHVNFTSFGPIAKLAPIMIKMVYSIAVAPSCQNIWKRAHQKGTVALRKIQRTPGTYPRPSTTCL